MHSRVIVNSGNTLAGQGEFQQYSFNILGSTLTWLCTFEFCVKIPQVQFLNLSVTMFAHGDWSILHAVFCCAAH